MGRSPKARRARAVEAGKPPRPPKGGGGVARGGYPSGPMPKGGIPPVPRAMRAVRRSDQVYVDQIQSVTISASNGSVAAWSVGDVTIGAPPKQPACAGPPCGCGRQLWTDNPDLWNTSRQEWYHLDDHSQACASAFTGGRSGTPPKPEWRDPGEDETVPSLSERVAGWFELPGNALAPRVGAGIMALVHMMLVVLAASSLIRGDGTWLTFAALAGNGSMVWLRLWQIRRAMSKPEIDPPPEPAEVEPPAEPIVPEPQPATSWPVRDFTAWCNCPNCGAVATHRMRPPGGSEGPKLADVIRQCETCGQEGEK